MNANRTIELDEEYWEDEECNGWIECLNDGLEEIEKAESTTNTPGFENADVTARLFSITLTNE